MWRFLRTVLALLLALAWQHASQAKTVRPSSRRGLGQLSTFATAALAKAHAALAVEKAYPVELNTAVDGVMPTGRQAARAAALARAKAAESGPNKIYGETEKLITMREMRQPSPLAGSSVDVLGMSLSAVDAGGTLMWAVAIFFGIPSPLLFVGVTEGLDVRFSHRVELWLATLLGKGEEQWATDRAEGFQAEAPLPYTAAVAAACVPVGFVVDQATTFMVSGDHGWSASLGTCAAIAALFLEVGRPKRLSREEKEMRDTLWQDFGDFAQLRLVRKTGGVHVSDVIKSFRKTNIRYIGSQRASDTDIEDAVRSWYQGSLSNAGFLRDVVLLSETDSMERANRILQEVEEKRTRSA